jgi:hypothetical protein
VHCKKGESQEEFGSHQVMGKEDKGTMEACKVMCSGHEWPPLLVTHDSRQGYVFTLSWIGFELTHWFIPYAFDPSKFLSPCKLVASLNEDTIDFFISYVSWVLSNIMTEPPHIPSGNVTETQDAHFV